MLLQGEVAQEQALLVPINDQADAHVAGIGFDGVAHRAGVDDRGGVENTVEQIGLVSLSGKSGEARSEVAS